MELSKDTLEQLNSSDHFELTFDEQSNIYSFTTDDGQYYEIQFISYCVSYQQEEFQTYMINLERPGEKNGLPKTYGDKLKNTIAIVMCQFLLTHDNAIIDVCSQEGNREAARDRLFNMWYNSFVTTYGITNLYKEDLQIGVGEPYAMYSSLYYTNTTPSINNLLYAYRHCMD